ncbi:MAG: NAD(P)-dependent glycerol-3-phosphate dehydrogenase [Gammaproteobacteria bacterium]|nr:NAD(P)-dependent glycerol-3-phosphate dehydrogenase [Gammaproteobacteria bacterium]
MSDPVAVIGAGSWGTALAVALSREGGQTRLWGHLPEALAEMEALRCNSQYLPGVVFPATLQICADLAECLDGVQDVLVVVPSGVFRSVLKQLQPLWTADKRLVWGTKGFEHGARKLLHQVAEEELGAEVPLAVLSGPSFAGEVALGMPTALTIASDDSTFATEFAQRLSGDSLRVYISGAVVATEVGGAVKNPMAIAAGISDGLGFGANARAALITRGLAEITRLGVALGAAPESFAGLAGVGDLLLTCSDDQSRNRRMGLAIAAGRSQAEAAAEIGQVVEGIQTTREVLALAHQLGVEMPIIEQLYGVLFEDVPPRAAVTALFSRSLQVEP